MSIKSQIFKLENLIQKTNNLIHIVSFHGEKITLGEHGKNAMAYLEGCSAGLERSLVYLKQIDASEED